MVVDARHDHSFRVPRPDQTVTMGTPNACNQCHPDKTPQWAVSVITVIGGPMCTEFDGKAERRVCGPPASVPA
jgi:hypothetical protein